uniref:hypothetical protein n=1 Tax=Serratia marcescens TaxID=615 RepID=UPI0016530014
ARNIIKIVLWYFFQESYFTKQISDFFTLISFLIMFLGGCLIGCLINKNAVFHASLAVALGVIFTFLISGVSSNDYAIIFHNSIAGVILGGAGGGVVLIVRKLCHLKSK